MKDLIIDCFAGGGGASVGIEMALGRHVDIAINHDPQAILMHKTNHPETLHLTEDIFKVDLQKYVKGRHVSLMWASPDCTSHSKAKGGKPREQGLRILPWAVYKHAKAILPDVIIMENVEEIQQWGPLDEKGHPIPERKGEDYKKFITAMKSLGYDFESRENEVNDIIQKCTWVSQFIMEYYGNGTGQGIREPLHTIVTKDRFALITVLGNEYAILDIFLRMLKPEELKLGQSFPRDYIIDRDYMWRKYNTGEQVARIGNSVAPIVAQMFVICKQKFF